jgi:conjugative relaxase-like TrwC/TraI family protein
VLTVAKVTAKVASGYANYLEGKTAAGELGDYYLKDGERVEAPGRWVAGAGAAGCKPGTVSPEALRELMAVRHPGTGEPLRAVGSSGEAVAALDATFSAPKSVSAAWALADPDLRQAIETAHEAAIDRAVQYAVAQVAMTRRRINRQAVIHERAAELVATSWRHTTARAVEGHPPDPQLHSHVLLHAAVRGDGRLVALDSRAWLNHRREVGAAYRTELAHELAQLGFGIVRGSGRGGRYFELAGIPQTLVDQWSSRRHQVEAAIQSRIAARAAAGLGSRLTPAEQRRAVVRSRAGKQPLSTAELDRHWLRVGAKSGLHREAIDRLREVGPVSLVPATVGELLSGLTEFDATFSEREARAVALERSVGVPAAAALEPLEDAREQGEVLALADGRATTARHRAMEEAVLATSTCLAERPAERVDPAAVDRAIEEINERLAQQGGQLSPEQLQALVLTTGGRPVVMIEGQAGTGKSTVLQAVALAHQAEGRHVIVTSTAAVAAERLARDLGEVGVAARVYSTAALQLSISTGALDLDANTTIIHDEAALASTREQHHLLDAVEKSGARLVIVGDPRQSKPVGAGGLWKRIERELADREARVELTKNLRTRGTEDRRDQRLFRDGEHEQALRGYADRGRIRVSPDQAATEDRALWAAHLDRQAGLRPLVLAQTSNDHLDELNARAQLIRLEDGQLGMDAIDVAGRPYRLHEGDEVQVRRTISLPDHDQIRNGSTTVIVAVDEETQAVRLRLADEREITLERPTIDRADLRLAYVQHPFPAQGATSDTAHLIVGEHATREGTYVAITRARQTTHIHASWEHLTADTQQKPITRLAALLGQSEPDLPSIATPLAHERRVEYGDRPESREEGQRPEAPLEPTDGSSPDEGRKPTITRADDDHGRPLGSPLRSADPARRRDRESERQRQPETELQREEEPGWEL